MKTKYLIKKILRKIYHFIGFISLFIIFIIPVKADTDSDVYTANTEIINSIYNDLLTKYQDYSSSFPYYSVVFQYGDLSNSFEVIPNNAGSYISGFLYYFSTDNYTTDMGRVIYRYSCSASDNCMYTYSHDEKGDNSYGQFNESILNLTSFRNYDGNLLLNGDTPPYFLSSIQDSIVTVNLDNYEYVLLTLKDYNQTQPFTTNLQVKGQIGITPIYNYGQTSKDSITGVRVQDRCNLSYSDFTPYPLYVIQSDLQNNVVYAVKSCISGSSFKFSSAIFNITYVTQSNLSDPTVTINGQTYHTIPYANLPSSATQNEVENYIPGETGGSGSPGGLAGAIIEAQKQMSSIWNVFTYFTDFVNQIFTALPPTLGNLLKTAFVVAITLGLIKIFIH